MDMRAAAFLARLGNRVLSMIAAVLILVMLLYGGIFSLGYGNDISGGVYL